MLIEPFLDYLRLEKNCSEKTIVSYGTDLTKFEEFFKSVDEEIDFTTVDADVIHCVLLWIRKRTSSLVKNLQRPSGK